MSTKLEHEQKTNMKLDPFYQEKNSHSLNLYKCHLVSYLQNNDLAWET